jgi:hypothetical protein
MKYLVTFLVLIISLVSNAQIFSEFDPGFEDLASQVSWLDIDSDGDLDLIQKGSGYNSDNYFVEKHLLYINEGSGTFTKIENFFENQMIVVDIKDFDGDGYVDFLISKKGFDPSGYTSIYKNEFMSSGGIKLIANINDYGGDGFIIDFDNDGDLDVVFSGQKFIQGRGGGWFFKTAIYKNEDGAFVEMDFDDNPFGFHTQCIRPIDINLDGNFEIVSSGSFEETVEEKKTNSETRLYTKNGDFLEKTILDTIGIHVGNLKVFDINNDSYPDITLTGAYWLQTSSTSKRREPLTRLIKNQSGSVLSIDQTHTISPTIFGYHDTGDFNNNGYSDVAIVGDSLQDFINISFGKAYSNNDGTFSELLSESLPPLTNGSIKLGDFDNDSDLDLAISGTFENSYENSITVIYKNDGVVYNTPPSAPLNLITQLVNDRFEFTWDASVDNETDRDGLTYNWYLRTEVDTIISSNSLGSGQRKIVEHGNLQYGTNHFLTRFMPPGDYFWSVQAVDNCYAGSPFASEQQFHVNFPPIISGVHEQISTPEETPITINLDDLVLNDPDNQYPEDFTMKLYGGDNYTLNAHEITPDVDFNGILAVAVVVNDLLDSSNVYILKIEVTPVNDIPVINRMTNELSTYEDVPFAIKVTDLIIVDPDNAYPEEFTIKIVAAENFTIIDNEIVTTLNFYGNISVPIVVNDGEDDSEVFITVVDVMPVNDIPVIEGLKSPIIIAEDSTFTLSLSDLVIRDPDNVYPDDFTLQINDGDNYSMIDNEVIPDPDYNGILHVSVAVHDTASISDEVQIEIEVTPVNDAPVIVDVISQISTPINTPIEITLSDILVSDPDNVYPDDFSLELLDGGYSGSY